MARTVKAVLWNHNKENPGEGSVPSAKRKNEISSVRDGRKETHLDPESLLKFPRLFNHTPPSSSSSSSSSSSLSSSLFWSCLALSLLLPHCESRVVPRAFSHFLKKTKTIPLSIFRRRKREFQRFKVKWISRWFSKQAGLRSQWRVAHDVKRHTLVDDSFA